MWRAACVAQLHMEDGKVVDAMVKRMREPAARATGLPGTVDTRQHSVRLSHFSTLSYVSPCPCARACSAWACVALRMFWHRGC